MRGRFVFRDKGKLRYLIIPKFAQTKLVRHLFSTRKGGASPPPFESLNLGLHTADLRENILNNRRKVARVLAINPAHLVTADQVHGSNIEIIKEKDRGKGALDHKSSVPSTDALITNIPDLPLAIFIADCLGVFILDPVHKSIGLIHSGWKGILSFLLEKTLRKMKSAYSTDPADCLVGIGPSIGPCCYEVSEGMALEFKRIFPQGKVAEEKEGKWRLDLKEALLEQLINSGVNKENVILSNLCTSCEKELFFSHRRDRGVTGRMMVIISLRGSARR